MKKRVSGLLISCAILFASVLAQTGTEEPTTSTSEPTDSSAAPSDGNSTAPTTPASGAIEAFDFLDGSFEDIACQYLDKNHLLNCNGTSLTNGNVT
jgi:hypothetical protein